MSYQPFPTPIKSSGNSTSETLSGSGTWTGSWEQTDRPSARIWVKAAGAATLKIQFSPDNGTTIDEFPFGGLTLTAGIPYYAHVTLAGQYFRLIIEDTSASSNAIISDVYYGQFAQQTSILSTGLNANTPMTDVKSVVFGQKPDDSYGEVGITDQSEILTSSAEANIGSLSVYNRTGISADAYAIIVDLSDTTNFPHSNTGYLVISRLKVALELASNSVGTVKIGVITRINGTNADLDFFFAVPFEKSAVRRVLSINDFSPNRRKLELSGEVPVNFITNVRSDAVAAVNTGATLGSPRGSGTVTPAVGDIIAFYDHNSGSAWDALIELDYYSMA